MTEEPLPDFFRLLLDRESNIDSANLEWYVENLDRDVLDYWAVEHPGRLRRSWQSGAALGERITVREYLRRTGVLNLFAMRDVVGISSVQSAVINPWGFVGYQFGEQLLIDLKYYRPGTVAAVVNGEHVKLEAYYAGPIPQSTWRHGRTNCVYFDPDTTTWRVATDVNTWRGTFTGRDGVWSLADLRGHKCQLAVLRSSLRRSQEILGRHLLPPHQDLWDMPAGGPSPASLLAASHLCGPFAVAEHLASGKLYFDETGTSIAAYMEEFAHVSLTRDDIYAGEP